MTQQEATLVANTKSYPPEGSSRPGAVFLLLVQDVMLSGVISSQASSLAAMTTNVVSVSRVAMPTLGGKLPSALTEGLFVGLPSVGMPSTSAETAAANGK